MENPIWQDDSRAELAQLLDALLVLRDDVTVNAEARLASVAFEWPGQDRIFSALNLSTYLAFRHHDVRPLQERLAHVGLSSLGRGEPNIIENIERVISMLLLAIGSDDPEQGRGKWNNNHLSGTQILAERNVELFGKAQNSHYTRIMTTLPSEAADNYVLIKELVGSGMNSARINCAHDNVSHWERMVFFIKKAMVETGRDCKIFMDLAGVKIRTGELGTAHNGHAKIRLFEGDVFDLRCDAKRSVPASMDPVTNELTPSVIACSSDIFIDRVKIGDSVWIDDGKLGSIIENVFAQGIRLRVTHAGPKGVRIKANKGINFPDSHIDLPTLTEKDQHDLDFICRNADILGLSYVQSSEDIERITGELGKRDSLMPIVAKIETRQAIENLPDILYKGLSYPGQFGIMIARGDLAVELGSVRMAEIQEEILWLCEAAHVPVIWATQVLESLAKKGVVSRPEITDAAMAVRAECVMLNKGRYIKSAVAVLRDILNRMQAHQYKKVARLRKLHW